MKSITPYPLTQRLEWGAKGYPFHPEFTSCAICNMAQTPIPVYLATYPQAQQELAALLEVETEDLACMTYSQAALLARRKSRHTAVAAARLLALPVLYYNEEYERRKAKHGRG